MIIVPVSKNKVVGIFRGLHQALSFLFHELHDRILVKLESTNGN